MVGSRNHGTGFRDNVRTSVFLFPWTYTGYRNQPIDHQQDHEAQSGAKLNNVLANFKGGKNFKPNIVIINVGTNNANDNDGVGQAYDLTN